DVEGNDDSGPKVSSVKDEDSNPYDEDVSWIPGKGKKGTLRSTDMPVFDVAGFDDGRTFRLRQQFREFVRVQLGNTWYRCSDFGLWRLHSNLKKLNGQWDVEPGQPHNFDTTNDDF